MPKPHPCLTVSGLSTATLPQALQQLGLELLHISCPMQAQPRKRGQAGWWLLSIRASDYAGLGWAQADKWAWTALGAKGELGNRRDWQILIRSSSCSFLFDSHNFRAVFLEGNVLSFNFNVFHKMTIVLLFSLNIKERKLMITNTKERIQK